MSNNNVSNIILDAIEAIVDPQLTEIRGSIPKVERMTITAVLKDGYKVDGLEDRVVTSETKKLYNIGDEVTVYYDNSAAIILTSVTTANDAFGQVEALGAMYQSVDGYEITTTSNEEIMSAQEQIIGQYGATEKECDDVNNYLATLSTSLIDTEALALWIEGEFLANGFEYKDNVSGVNYGLSVELEGANGNPKKTYTLDINRMTGNPYAFYEGARQVFVVPINLKEVNKITKISFFITGIENNEFNNNENQKVSVKNIVVKPVWKAKESIPAVPVITINTPQGVTFTRIDGAQTDARLSLAATVMQNGEDIAAQQYQWYMVDGDEEILLSKAEGEIDFNPSNSTVYIYDKLLAPNDSYENIKRTFLCRAKTQDFVIESAPIELTWVMDTATQMSITMLQDETTKTVSLQAQLSGGPDGATYQMTWARNILALDGSIIHSEGLGSFEGATSAIQISNFESRMAYICNVAIKLSNAKTFVALTNKTVDISYTPNLTTSTSASWTCAGRVSTAPKVIFNNGAPEFTDNEHKTYTPWQPASGASSQLTGEYRYLFEVVRTIEVGQISSDSLKTAFTVQEKEVVIGPRLIGYHGQDGDIGAQYLVSIAASSMIYSVTTNEIGVEIANPSSILITGQALDMQGNNVENVVWTWFVDTMEQGSSSKTWSVAPNITKASMTIRATAKLNGVPIGADTLTLLRLADGEEVYTLVVDNDSITIPRDIDEEGLQAASAITAKVLRGSADVTSTWSISIAAEDIKFTGENPFYISSWNSLSTAKSAVIAVTATKTDSDSLVKKVNVSVVDGGVSYKLIVTPNSFNKEQAVGVTYSLQKLSNGSIVELPKTDYEISLDPPSIKFPAPTELNVDGYAPLPKDIIPVYYEYIDVFEDKYSNATKLPTPEQKKKDVFKWGGYDQRLDVPVIYKTDVSVDLDEAPEFAGPDLENIFYYEGQGTIDNVVYDKWRQIDNTILIWNNQASVYIYTERLIGIDFINDTTTVTAKINDVIVDQETISAVSNGIDAFVGSLSNEAAAVPCSSTGAILEETVISTDSVLYHGIDIVPHKVTLARIDGIKLEVDGNSVTWDAQDTTPFISGLANKHTINFIFDKSEAKLTGNQIIAIGISNDNGYSIEKQITITPQFAGSDATVNMINTFNALTNNGTYKGIFYADAEGNKIEPDDANFKAENVDLYLNATMIKTGRLEVANGNRQIFAADVSEGAVNLAGWDVTAGAIEKDGVVMRSDNSVLYSSAIDTNITSPLRFGAGGNIKVQEYWFKETTSQLPHSIHIYGEYQLNAAHDILCSPTLDRPQVSASISAIHFKQHDAREAIEDAEILNTVYWQVDEELAESIGIDIINNGWNPPQDAILIVEVVWDMGDYRFKVLDDGSLFSSAGKIGPWHLTNIGLTAQPKLYQAGSTYERGRVMFYAPYRTDHGTRTSCLQQQYYLLTKITETQWSFISEVEPNIYPTVITHWFTDSEVGELCGGWGNLNSPDYTLELSSRTIINITAQPLVDNKIEWILELDAPLETDIDIAGAQWYAYHILYSIDAYVDYEYLDCPVEFSFDTWRLMHNNATCTIADTALENQLIFTPNSWRLQGYNDDDIQYKLTITPGRVEALTSEANIWQWVLGDSQLFLTEAGDILLTNLLDSSLSANDFSDSRSLTRILLDLQARVAALEASSQA